MRFHGEAFGRSLRSCQARGGAAHGDDPSMAIIRSAMSWFRLYSRDPFMDFDHFGNSAF